MWTIIAAVPAQTAIELRGRLGAEAVDLVPAAASSSPWGLAALFAMLGLACLSGLLCVRHEQRVEMARLTRLV